MSDAAELDDLVAGLSSLHDLERAKGRLLARGPAAIPALRHYLCHGAPEVVYEPRRAAVEVLASLGARDALLDYLRQPRLIANPVVRMAEEAVENAAARALARWREPEVYQALLGAAARGPRAGVLEALAAFARPESIPYFLQALEDGLCEEAAAAALRRFGRQAEWPLLGAVRTPLPSAQRERPTSLRRRRRALDLLVELEPSVEVWPWLRPMLADADPSLAVGAAKIAARLGGGSDKAMAVERLLAVLPTADWFLQGEIQDCLGILYSEARPRIEREIAARMICPPEQRGADAALRILLALCRKLGSGPELPRGRTA